MGYRALINRNLDTAFRLIDDLAEDALLLRSETPEFDFSMASAQELHLVATPVRVFVMDSKKSSAERNTVKKQVLMKTKDHTDLTVYDSLRIGDVTWRFTPTSESDGYTTLADISREV